MTMTQTPAMPDLPSRNIILCFDGTGNKFGENSNVVRFFHALVKDNPERQLVYYQPGIGTYNQRQFITQTVSTIASAIDQGVALHINDHVKEGYQYIMRNYRKGDKICLFGFSRGAHTARVVAGMLYKVGILPAHNDQQLDFAFSVYQMTGDEGYELSKEFKQTFAMPVTVEFVGVWDTVSSVGIIPRSHPYTSVNYAVKHFRHALALDERRARFRPNVWNEATLEREQELDVDEPDVAPRGDVSRDEWVYEPPDRDICDVQEVWFSGCHADVGGGSHHNKIRDSLSYIPLRWMIKECLLTTDILFEVDLLPSLGFDVLKLGRELEAGNIDLDKLGFDLKALEDKDAKKRSQPVPADPAPSIPLHVVSPQATHIFPHLYSALIHAKARADALAKIFDQLIEAKSWWLLEVIPLLATYQKEDGSWIRKRMRNFGQGRYIPFHDDEVKVHISVQERMKETENDPVPYTPAAYNWGVVKDSGMLTWVI
ncbi:hypothetical protein Hypma_013275 [Hypsizygus marmoreus]|uniref:T6SS Phospholipase effector Tle1-like catalytic domain-containing protein n=1 Tax=Hypsizygus marmoreus TaxID=39966 RepID=A0A369JC14_HYPMA|nr:hypothetical protein Hypma_013275 [Hypsizygus marmoreus]